MTGRVVEFRAAVVAGIKSFMPSLRSCEAILGRFALEDLEKSTIAAPAVRVGTPLVEPVITNAEQHEAKVQTVAFCIAEGRDQDSDVWTMAEAIALKLTQTQRWGLGHIKPPTDIKIVPILTTQRNTRAVSMIAVSWSQTLSQLGANVFDAAGHVLEELYINGEVVELAAEGETP